MKVFVSFRVDIWKIYPSYSEVPVNELFFLELRKFQVFSIEVCVHDRVHYMFRKFPSFFMIKLNLPRHDQVGVEVGEGVPGGTDRHVGEVQV